MPRPLNEQTVVITGASSGIGRLSALEFAGRGASVVLAARNENALREVAHEIEAAGGKAMIVATDVAHNDQVERLARAAVEHFGQINTWVNNAGLSMYATVEQMSVEEIERIIQVDLMGTIYGCKAAIPIMRGQGGGSIINVSSVLGVRAVPLQVPYCAAKHGVKGFTEGLRTEMEREKTGIDLTLILPASINTPFFGRAGSKQGVRPQPLPPVYPPEDVADAIVFAAEHPRRDIFVGGAGKLFDVLQRISPKLVDFYMLQGDRGAENQLTDRPDDGRNNLFEPTRDSGAVHGEFGHMTGPISLYTRIFEKHPALKPMAMAAVAIGIAALVWRRRDGHPGGNGYLHRARQAAEDAAEAATGYFS